MFVNDFPELYPVYSVYPTFGQPQIGVFLLGVMVGVSPKKQPPFLRRFYGVALQALSGLNSETLMNLLMAWYYSGYYTGEYAARQGKM